MKRNSSKIHKETQISDEIQIFVYFLGRYKMATACFPRFPSSCVDQTHWSTVFVFSVVGNYMSMQNTTVHIHWLRWLPDVIVTCLKGKVWFLQHSLPTRHSPILNVMILCKWFAMKQPIVRRMESGVLFCAYLHFPQSSRGASKWCRRGHQKDIPPFTTIWWCHEVVSLVMGWIYCGSLSLAQSQITSFRSDWRQSYSKRLLRRELRRKALSSIYYFLQQQQQ